MAPGRDLPAPTEQGEHDRRDERHRRRSTEDLQDGIEQHQPARRGQDEIGGQRERAVPLRDRLQRGVDHRGAADRRHGRRRRDDPDDRDPAVGAPQNDPPQSEQTGRDEGDDRRDAFTREPRTPPLGKRPPRSLAIAEMRGRRQKAGADQGEGQAEADEAEPQVRGHRADARHDAEQGDEAVPGAGRCGEEDDGIGGMHRRSSVRRSSGAGLRSAVFGVRVLD